MKTTVYIATSLDGYIARENGDLDWLPGSDGGDSGAAPGEDYGYQALMESVDVLIWGRRTFEMVLSFGAWPYAGKKVMVLSRTLSSDAENIPENVEILSGSPKEIVRKLEETGLQHAYVDGGQTIQRFLAAGLIDELIITRVPVLIGSGIPLFGALQQDIPLQLQESHSWENGFVQSRYSVAR